MKKKPNWKNLEKVTKKGLDVWIGQDEEGNWKTWCSNVNLTKEKYWSRSSALNAAVDAARARWHDRDFYKYKKEWTERIRMLEKIAGIKYKK